MHRKIIALLLSTILLTGCTAPPKKAERKQYQATFLNLFDTVTYICGFSDSEEAFQQQAQSLHDELLVYHQLFDIYNDYDGIANLKTINDHAGISPVKVDEKILHLLTDCRTYYELTGHRVNTAMGSVLSLWHTARTDGLDDPTNAALPDPEALKLAAAHTSWDNVILDPENATVYLSDPEMRLDVGAVAKGWAARQVAEGAPSGLLISLGGNVCATGPKDSEGTPWVVGISDPDQRDAYLHTLNITDLSIVTSGDYQRYYIVDGNVYHHIIDPNTLYPAAYWRAVTVACEDSGLADALSTALFLLPRDEGQVLLQQCGAEAMWVDLQGRQFYSPGFQELIRT